jgi:ubiquinone/menaquinone biosynthesis C-methylase UbiE
VINRLFRAFSAKSRARKISILDQRFPQRRGFKVLDIGGQVDEATAQVIESHEGTLYVVNIMREHLETIKAQHPGVRVVVADARCLPFADDAFDLVYSNAVIEHVGDFDDQAAMAREVARVGKSWFITTPNRWFPFEFHMRLPFVSWLPARTLRRVGRMYSYNHVARRYESGIDRQLRLMTKGEMRRVFPQSEIVACRVTIFPETLIAIGSDSGGASS